MAAPVKVPGPIAARVLEWRAGQIDDPIEKLRFLNGAAHRAIHAPRFQWRWNRRFVVVAALSAAVLIPAFPPSRARGIAVGPRPAAKSTTASPDPSGQVWPVETNTTFELYSNGLRIENEFATRAKERSHYPVFQSQVQDGGDDREQPVAVRTGPAGIVYHTTESLQAPFEASEVRSLKRIGRNLLEYVRSKESYHFVIDRFGRVYRVVAESDVANHAGHSVWSDDTGTYVDLNASFLSVAFEAQTDASTPLSAAQMHAARVLTEMLRSKYRIRAANCVTHAQVSVNPLNMRIGYHTDWAAAFPFASIGLPDNYAEPVPSMLVFGFEYDENFLSTVGRPWPGLAAADRLIADRALAEGVSRAAYRRLLEERYRRIINSAHTRSSEENQDET